MASLREHDETVGGEFAHVNCRKGGWKERDAEA